MKRAVRLLLLALTALASAVTLVEGLHARTSAGLHHIGVVLVGVSGEQSDEANAFRKGLTDLGYVEGRDIAITWRESHGSFEPLSAFVDDLLKQKVDLLVVESTLAALAAKRATGTIPIVMALVGDPVGSGLVESLARPGGNITGLMNLSPDIAAKRLQLLHEALPKARRVAVLFNPDTPYTARYVTELEAAAKAMKLQPTFISTRTPEQVRSALSRMSLASTDVLMPIDDGFMASQGNVFLQIASRVRVPVVFADTSLARQGALLSYAVDHSSLFRRAADYVDKILKGASPASLPVEQPTKFVLVVNLRTAKTLGLEIPNSVLIQADEVIR